MRHMHPTDINEKIFFRFYRRKNYLSYNNVVQQHFDTNILSRGYLTKLKNYGKFKGVGGGRGGMTSTP